MNPIDSLFQRLRAAGKKAFIPFLTAGDPDIQTTEVLVRQLTRSGASMVEIGFPYSDPLADGPVVQASYTRALDKGVRVDDILAMVQGLATSPEQVAPTVPLVGMLSFTLIHRRGPKAFLDQAQKAGLSGVIVPDLPLEEADVLTKEAKDRDFKLVQLVTPTTPRQRAVKIANLSTGFLYYVAITGITGERDRLPEELTTQLTWLRKQTRTPICVGFGISKPDHVGMLREVVDGIIVGSAFVRHLEGAKTKPLAAILQEMANLAKTLEQALNP
ncbi:MAG: tryptophan synthase subunit alpha [Gemmataceae bacterium]